MIDLATLLPSTALTRYDDHGEPSYTVGERVLMALRNLGESTTFELTEALSGIERSAVSSSLQHYLRVGKVRLRVVQRTRLYALVAEAFRPKVPHCANCKSPPEPGRKMCAECRNANAAYQRKRYAAGIRRAA